MAEHRIMDVNENNTQPDYHWDDEYEKIQVNGWKNLVYNFIGSVIISINESLEI